MVKSKLVKCGCISNYCRYYYFNINVILIIRAFVGIIINSNVTFSCKHATLSMIKVKCAFRSE